MVLSDPSIHFIVTSGLNSSILASFPYMGMISIKTEETEWI